MACTSSIQTKLGDDALIEDMAMLSLVVELLLALNCLINTSTCSPSQIDSYYVTNATFDNVTCSRDNVVVTLNNVNDVQCARTCSTLSGCTGFTHNAVTKTCVGCSVSEVATDLDVIYTGMNFFTLSTHSETGGLGQFCSAESPCSDTTFVCLEDACTCEPGYSFDPASGTCKDGCETYGDTFLKYDDHRVHNHNVDRFTHMTSWKECRYNCVAHAWCVSFEFNPDTKGKTLCTISNITALLEGGRFYIYKPGFNYYNRNC